MKALNGDVFGGADGQDCYDYAFDNEPVPGKVLFYPEEDTETIRPLVVMGVSPSSQAMVIDRAMGRLFTQWQTVSDKSAILPHNNRNNVLFWDGHVTSRTFDSYPEDKTDPFWNQD
jgi:prepilin-type processing-associated H-X9-DG protein